MMLLVSMGCGGSRADTIEPRYYESWTRETESTWLTNTDTDATQIAIGSYNNNQRGTTDTTGTTINENMASCSGEDSGQTASVRTGSSLREKKMVNTGTQCRRQSCHPSFATGNQRRPTLRDEVKLKSKIASKDVVGTKIVRPVACMEKAVP